MTTPASPKQPVPFRDLIAGAIPSAKNPRSYSDAAREEMLSRLSPYVMKKVWEALERTEEGIYFTNVEHGNYYRCAVCRGAKKLHESSCPIGQALSALNA